MAIYTIQHRQNVIFPIGTQQTISLGGSFPYEQIRGKYLTGFKFNVSVFPDNAGDICYLQAASFRGGVSSSVDYGINPIFNNELKIYEPLLVDVTFGFDSVLTLNAAPAIAQVQAQINIIVFCTDEPTLLN